jgi:hypothetical protein
MSEVPFDFSEYEHADEKLFSSAAKQKKRITA